MTHQSTPLIQALQQTDAATQEALNVFALACAPLTLTVLKAAMSKMKLDTKNITSVWRSSLVEVNIIKMDGGRMELHPHVHAYILQSLAAEGRYVAMYQTVNPVYNTQHVTKNFTEPRKSAFALYGDDEKARRASLRCPSLAFEPKMVVLKNNETIIHGPNNPKWLASLAEDVRFHVLYCMAQYGLAGYITGLSLRQIEAEISSSTEMMTHSGVVTFMAELQLWRGEINQAEQAIALLEAYPAWVIRGRIALLRGQHAVAKQAFETAISRSKKGDSCLQAYDPLFYALALLACKENSKLQTFIDKQLKRKMILSEHRFPLTCLKRFLDHKAMQKDFDLTFMMEHIRQEQHAAVGMLLLILLCRWLDVKQPEFLIKASNWHQYNASNAELYWLFWQLDRATSLSRGAKLSKEEAAAIQERRHELEPKQVSEQWVSLESLLPKEEPWERSLQALLAIASPTATHGHGGDAERIAWMFHVRQDKNNIILSDNIEPRTQKVLKSGAWSKGRKVALARLIPSAERASKFPFLTTQDKDICATIEQYEIHEWWQRETITAFNLLQTLRAAVGHPHLLVNDANTPFHLSQGNIVVQVLRESGMIRIRLDPWPDERRIVASEDNPDQSLLLQWETPQRLTIYDVTSNVVHIANILGKDGLCVPEAAQDQALEGIAAIAPLLTVHSAIGGEGQQAAEVVEADPRLHIQLQPIGDGLQLSCFVRPFGDAAPLLMHPAEGGKTLFTEHDGRTLQTERDLVRENALSQRLFTAAPQLDSEEGWHWQLDEAEDALEALEGVQELGDDAMLEWPQDRKITLGKKMDVAQMKVSMHKQQDWFSMEGEVQVSEDQVIGLKQLMQLMDGSPGRFVKLDNDQFLNLSDALHKRLSALKSMTDEGRFHGLAAGAIDDVIDGMNVRKNKNWQSHLGQLQASQNFQPVLPSTLQAELRDYQLEGFCWMSRLAHWGAGACLADDMGLGKTVQALALILSHASEGPTLVIAPTSVGMNWEEEAARFAPTLNVHNFAASDRKSMIAEAGPFDLVICSYGLLQRNGALLASRPWQTIVLDEAQAIKNFMTKRAKAAVALEAKVRLITTGTPIENHLGELWSLFEFINPGLLGNLESFNRRFANPIQVQENKEVAQRLRQLVHPFVLRRLKSQVLTELPPRTEVTIHVELSAEELALYEATRRQAIERIQESSGNNPGEQRIKILAEIMRLRRACCHPSLVMPETTITGSKLAAFSETINELRESNHKALVFSQFVGHLSILRKHLEEQNIPYQYLDGSTPVAQRKKRVNAFQAGEGDVFLISLKAGGAGLNLTAADYVLHMDPWWNPAVEDQASDRAHRMGQKRPVTIYRFIAKNTVEDKIVQLHHQKRDLADSLLEGSDSSGTLSLNDIMKLVEESAQD
jgi:hypothetical protein